MPKKLSAKGQLQAELASQNEALRYSQKMAEGALERFAALFSNVPLALLVVDENGLVLECNAMALANLRPQESDPPLNFLFPLVLPVHLAAVTQAFGQAKEQSASKLTGIEFSSGNALLTADLHIARIENPQDDLANFICAIVDQGPLLDQMAQSQALQAQLREAQKMQAIGTLAGGIAHDFNNILGAILGNAELALQDAAAGAAVRTSLIEIEKAAGRARDLVRQILTFSRKEPLARNIIDLAPVVEEAARLVRVGLPPHIECTVDIQTTCAVALADATQVQQALLNLCTNGIQAIGANRGRIGIRLSANAQNIEMQVSDSGVGMEAETQDRVFEPFFTTKPTGQGTGLGLAVVHGIMRAHDGAVTLQSAPGKGSVFTLSFPHRVSEPPVDMAVRTVTAIAKSGTGQHILYVDDDQALVFLVQRALTHRGYRVSTFTDPQLALKAIQKEPDTFDLLVTDYNMPNFSGIDLLRDAKVLCPDLPVAVASGYVTAEIEQAALAAGAKALIHKPNGVHELIDLVQSLVQDKAVV